MFFKYSFDRTYIQTICVIFMSLSLLSDGMQMSWSAPSMNLLMRADSPFSVKKEDMVWLEIITPIFAMLTIPLICSADKLGRKILIALSSSLGMVAWLLIAIGNSKELLYIARSLAGVASAVAFVCIPMYITEITDKNRRGFKVSIILVMYHLGVILMYAITPNTSLRLPPIIGMIALFVALVIVSFFPESPYYHISRKDEDAAKGSLSFFQGEKGIDEKLKSLKAELAEKKDESGCKDLFRTENKKFLFILIFAYASQPATGYMALLMNLNFVMESSGVTLMTPYAVTLVYSSVLLAATVISMFLVDIFGRRFLMCVSILCISVSLLILAIFFHLKFLEFNLKAMSWIPVIAINAFAFFYKTGLGSVAIVLAPEVCPPEFRTVGMATGNLFYDISTFISIYFFHYVMENFGLFVVFYSFSFLSFLSFFISYILIPETKGKTLQEIQVMLN